jgi:hypothetical protein
MLSSKDRSSRRAQACHTVVQNATIAAATEQAIPIGSIGQVIGADSY